MYRVQSIFITKAFGTYFTVYVSNWRGCCFTSYTEHTSIPPPPATTKPRSLALAPSPTKALNWAGTTNGHMYSPKLQYVYHLIGYFVMTRRGTCRTCQTILCWVWTICAGRNTLYYRLVHSHTEHTQYILHLPQDIKFWQIWQIDFNSPKHSLPNIGQLLNASQYTECVQNNTNIW